jgi:hypothetical protein
MRRITVVIILLSLLAVQVVWADEEYIGSIKTLDGTVKVIRQGNVVQPVAGTRLSDRDTLRTGHDGSVGIILRDDTIFSLGPDSTLDMQEFRFDPQKRDFSLVCRLVRGTFIFVSGVIAKLSPESVKIETPDGTVAIRGTRLAIQVQNQ